MTFPDLARTFHAIVTDGKDGFYKGRVAQAIVDLIKSKGGPMELDDLASHETSFVEPIKYNYGGDVTVYEVRSFCTLDFLKYLYNLSVNFWNSVRLMDKVRLFHITFMYLATIYLL